MESYSVDRSKWAKLSIFEQMGNIYSEVGRSFSAMRRGNELNQNSAVYRAIDLFDATIYTNLTKNPHRAKEVLRAKDQYLQVFYGEESAKAPVNIAALDSYFMHFALAARLAR